MQLLLWVRPLSETRRCAPFLLQQVALGEPHPTAAEGLKLCCEGGSLIISALLPSAAWRPGASG